MPPVIFIVAANPDVAGVLARAASELEFNPVIFAGGHDFLNHADRSRHGCILLEVDLADISGLEVQKHLRDEGCMLPLIMHSAQANIPMCVEAMQQGAIHFFEHPLNMPKLSEVLRLAVERDDELRRQAGEHLQARSQIYRLDEKERQLLRLMARGKQNKELATEFDVSVRTIQSRITRMMRKLGAESKSILLWLGSELSAGPPRHHFPSSRPSAAPARVPPPRLFPLPDPLTLPLGDSHLSSEPISSERVPSEPIPASDPPPATLPLLASDPEASSPNAAQDIS